jgi:hypothetical protein
MILIKLESIIMEKIKTVNHKNSFPTRPHYAIVEFEESFSNYYDSKTLYHYSENQSVWEDKIKELEGNKKSYFAFIVNSNMVKVKTIVEI